MGESTSTGGTLRLDTATLSYTVHDGAGPTVVALHGMGGSRAADAVAGYVDWFPVVRAGRRLVRYDARGHGRSTGRAVPDDYTWARLADDLLALLDAVSPDEPVDAVGVSMGTGTLLHAVTRRPERFRRLALALPPTAWETRAAQGGAYRAMADLVETQGAAALATLMASAPNLPLLVAGGWTSPAPDVAEDLLPAFSRGAAASDLPTPALISTIRQPVLLTPWIDDPSHPVSTAQRLHELIPGSALELMQTAADVRALGRRVADFFTSAVVR